MRESPARKTGLVLFALIGFGILLEVTVIHASYRPASSIWYAAIVLHLVFLLVAPIVVLRTPGERILRAMLIGTWTVYVVLWGIGIHRLYQE